MLRQLSGLMDVKQLERRLVVADKLAASMDADNCVRLAGLLFDLDYNSGSAVAIVNRDMEGTMRDIRIVTATRWG